MDHPHRGNAVGTLEAFLIYARLIEDSSSRVRVPALGAGACLSFPYRAAPAPSIASRVFTP
jgi:hypothetical protein